MEGCVHGLDAVILTALRSTPHNDPPPRGEQLQVRWRRGSKGVKLPHKK